MMPERSSPLVNQGGDEGGPAGLMRGAEAFASVAVEKFVKEQIVAPVRVVLKLFLRTVNGPLSILISHEQRDQTIGKAIRHFFERDFLFAVRDAVDGE